MFSERPKDPEYGRGIVELAPDEIPPSAPELLEALARTFDAPQYQPPVLPRAATELLAIAHKSDTPIARITSLLESDAVLAARVLSRANSATFGGKQPARTLREAVSRLGLSALRDVVLEQAMKLRVFRAPAYQPLMEAISHHASTTAEIARLVCRYATMDGELAFLAGLLHDVGAAGILIALSELPKDQRPDALLLDYALAQAHVAASERMIGLWKLPPELALAVRHHHDIADGKMVHPLSSVIAVAEAEAAARGAGLQNLEPTRPVVVERAAAALGLDERRLKLMRADLDRLLPPAAPSRGNAPPPTAARR